MIDIGGELGALSSAVIDLGGDYAPPQESLATLRRDDHFVNTVYRNVVVRVISVQKLARLHESTGRVLELLADPS